MSEAKHVNMRDLRRGDMSMRLMINRAHDHMRIMDYRVGNYQDKRAELDELVQSEGLRKVFTLVEKQDSQNWKGVGFFREGVYPSFFRTADAYAMSLIYDENGAPIPNAGPLKAQPNEQTRFPGRKLTKPDGLKIEFIKNEREREEVISGVNGDLRALPFGRMEPPDIVILAKTKQLKVWAVAEVDDSFGHATVGFSPAPSCDPSLVLTAFAGNSLLNAAREANVNNLFGLSPNTDRWTNELYSGLGFRVTGRLADHLKCGDTYTPALLWHCRI